MQIGGRSGVVADARNGEGEEEGNCWQRVGVPRKERKMKSSSRGECMPRNAFVIVKQFAKRCQRGYGRTVKTRTEDKKARKAR